MGNSVDMSNSYRGISNTSHGTCDGAGLSILNRDLGASAQMTLAKAEWVRFGTLTSQVRTRFSNLARMKG